MSIRKKVTLTICSIIILLFVLLGTFIYLKSAKYLNANAESYMLTQLERTQENIDLLIQINKLETESLARDSKVLEFMDRKINVNEINGYLTDKINKDNNKQNIYMDYFILNHQGRIIATCMPTAMDLDLSTREYFKESVKTKSTVISDILIARSDGSQIVIIVSPIKDSNGIISGYMGIALRAYYYSDIISRLKLGKTGYFSIVDSNNYILSHPNKEFITQKSIYDNTENLLNKGKYLITDIVEKRTVVNRGIKELQIFKLMDSTNWLLIAILPENEMYQQSIELLSYIILIGIIFVFFSIYVGMYISKKISKPIVAITKYIDSVSKSNLLIKKSVIDSINSFNNTDIIQEQNDISEDEITNLEKSVWNYRYHIKSIINAFEIKSEKLTKDINELADTIENTSYRIAKFISTLSHDLKTSVTLIKGYAKGLNSGLIKDKDIERSFLEGILNSTQDIEDITCDILDSTYEAQCCPKLNKEKVNTEEFIEDLFEKTKVYIINSKRNFLGDYKCQEGKLFIDATKIKRVWDNLINNAIKYSNEGSTIEINIIEEVNKVKFEVIDEGIGIKADEISKVFDLFYRGNDSKKGYGLGLFISKSIIQAHNSNLYVSSVEGKGSRFWFYLHK